MSIQKMSYDKVIDRYNELQIKYNKLVNENTKLLKIIRKYEKEIRELKTDNIELSMLLDVKIKKFHWFVAV